MFLKLLSLEVPLHLHPTTPLVSHTWIHLHLVEDLQVPILLSLIHKCHGASRHHHGVSYLHDKRGHSPSLLVQLNPRAFNPRAFVHGEQPLSAWSHPSALW